MTKKRNAIVVYVDPRPKCLTEFSWLWKTWMMWSIHENWDLIAFVDPEVKDEVNSKFAHDNLIVIEKEGLNKKDTVWEGYGFVNSFGMFDESESTEMLLKNYQYVFKTDCDTFLTGNFKNFEPDPHRVHLGIGMYYPDEIDLIESVREKLKAVSNSYGYNFRSIHHIGASIIGPTGSIINLCRDQMKITETLLKYGWQKGDVGQWPGWWKGVSSMYAMEIAVNNYLGPMSIVKGCIDVYCTHNTIMSTDLHIHAWQCKEDMFNKKKFHAGELPIMKYNKIPKIAGEYCLLVANEDLDYLRICVAKES